MVLTVASMRLRGLWFWRGLASGAGVSLEEIVDIEGNIVVEDGDETSRFDC
jgi:hypothetical protein